MQWRLAGRWHSFAGAITLSGGIGVRGVSAPYVHTVHPVGIVKGYPVGLYEPFLIVKIFIVVFRDIFIFRQHYKFFIIFRSSIIFNAFSLIKDTRALCLPA